MQKRFQPVVIITFTELTVTGRMTNVANDNSTTAQQHITFSQSECYMWR